MIAMRVLLISHTCQSQTEGQPRARQLGRIDGLELRVIVPDRWFHYGQWRAAQTPVDPTFEFEAMKVAWPWTGPGQFYLHWYPGLARAIREFRPDIIDIWEEPWALVSVQACRLRNRMLPAARIVCETEQNLNKRLPPPFEWFRSYTLRNADFVVARNREAVNVVRSHGFAGPAEVVPNAVDESLFRPMDRQECRAALGFARFVVGYVGRLVEEKGLFDLVDAIAACPPAVNVVMVGSGPLAGALQARIGRQGLGDRARILPARPLGELPRLMNAIDCLALPSHTTARWKEQFGRVIIEANACGTPVIGSDSGAIPDVVGPGGMIVPERNPQALAAAIGRLATDPSLGAAMGKLGLERVRETYTWSAVARQMHGIYRRVSKID